MALSLRSFSTMKIGGSAEKIIRLKDLTQLQEKLPDPIRILGNGSNILIDDRGLKGTVIVVRDFPPEEPRIILEDERSVVLEASAGIFLPTISRWTAKRGLSGCEYMVGVPGTLGGALVQNAGANEQDLSMILVSAKVFDLKTSALLELSPADCKLSYRHSKLKERPDWVVVSLQLRLAKVEASAIEHRVELNLQYRKDKTPYFKPSLGSIYTRLSDGENWIYPGKLIQDAGLKGFTVGGAQVSPIHANYIVNESGNATFEEVHALMEHVEKTVLAQSGKKLQREVLVWSDLL